MENASIFELKPVNGQKSFYGKAQVLVFMGEHYLKSYDTLVCSYNPNSGAFWRLWTGYSATTMRHVNAFLALYGLPGGGKQWWDSFPVNFPIVVKEAGERA